MTEAISHIIFICMIDYQNEMENSNMRPDTTLRNQQIYEAYQNGLTHAVIAKKFNISASRVAQIINAAKQRDELNNEELYHLLKSYNPDCSQKTLLYLYNALKAANIVTKEALIAFDKHMYNATYCTIRNIGCKGVHLIHNVVQHL